MIFVLLLRLMNRLKTKIEFKINSLFQLTKAQMARTKSKTEVTGDSKEKALWELFPESDYGEITFPDDSDYPGDDCVPGNGDDTLCYHIRYEVGKRHPKPNWDDELDGFPFDMTKLSQDKWGLDEYKIMVHDAHQRKHKIDLELVQVARKTAKRIVDDMESAGEIDRFIKTLKDERAAKRARKLERLKEIEDEFGSSCDDDSD